MMSGTGDYGARHGSRRTAVHECSWVPGDALGEASSPGWAEVYAPFRGAFSSGTGASHFLKHMRLRAIALELRHRGSRPGNVGDRPQYSPPARPPTVASHCCAADIHCRWARDT